MSTVLQGKYKPIWHQSQDVGDHVVVINTKVIPGGANLFFARAVRPNVSTLSPFPNPARMTWLQSGSGHAATALPGTTRRYNHGYTAGPAPQDVSFSGEKWDQKLYRRHTGYPGGFREVAAKDMHAKKPTEVIRKAVYGMLPRNKLRKTWMSR